MSASPEPFGCPGRELDEQIAPLVRTMAPDPTAIADVCGWDGALAAVLAERFPLASGLCASHLVPCIDQARRRLAGTGWEVTGSFGMPSDGAGKFDAAVLRAPYWLGNKAVEALVGSACLALEPGGALYLVGERKRGVRTFARFLEARLSACEHVLVRGAVRIYRATRTEAALDPADIADTAERLADRFEVEAGGVTFFIARHPAVFSDGRLDPATKLLIAALPSGAARALDLGCGAGAVAVAMALRSPESEVWAVDSNLAAVEACSRSLKLNGLSNIRAQAAHLGEGLEDGSFGLIACYPPFHVGPRVSHEVGEAMMREAARLLGPEGSLYVVQSSAQRLEKLLESLFNAVSPVAAESGFRVLECRGPAPGSGRTADS